MSFRRHHHRESTIYIHDGVRRLKHMVFSSRVLSECMLLSQKGS